MRNAIASALVIIMVIGLAGCEGNAQPGAQAILGYQVDEARNRSIWLTRDGVQIHSAAARPVSIDLPGWIYAGAPYCPPVVALGPTEIVVTSNVIPTLWRIDAATLAVTVHPVALASDQDKDVGFAALAYSREQDAFVAYSETLRSLWRVDAKLSSAVKLAGGFERQRAARTTRSACAELARRLEQPID